MTNPLIVFRIGYMDKYDGPAPIVHGGNWIEQNGRGGEMWNFRKDAGRVYGFVMTKKERGLNLKRIDPGRKKWKRGDVFDGVDIVFIARGTSGQVVVGWYRNAKVFNRQYWKRPNPKLKERTGEIAYLAEANAEDARLLLEKERKFHVPFAPADGYGPGQANVWYGDQRDKRSKSLVAKLRKYIGTKTQSEAEKVAAKSGGWGTPLPKQKLLEIEKASMEATEKHFAKSHSIEIVARDNRGWDITAIHKKNKSALHLEVKGHLGNVIQFELTPNEYGRMQDMKSTYRICVVRNALNSDTVEVYTPKKLPDGNWELHDKENGIKVILNERIGARASQVS